MKRAADIKATIAGLLIVLAAITVFTFAVKAFDAHKTKVDKCHESMVGFSELEVKAECRF